MLLKKFIPKSAKLHWRLLQRHFLDQKTGIANQFASPRLGDEQTFQFSISMRQPIPPNPFLENKLHNLRLAIQKIEQVVVLPNQVFSFWKIVGEPSGKHGFREGRNLIGGEMRSDVGGGLCQISGILYHAALLIGLKIEERHPHSVDFYEDSERLSPLGTDATVVFGYKDLRLRNPFDFPLRFGFDLEAESLVCRVESEQPLVQRDLFFEVQIFEKRKIVVVLAGSAGAILGESVYQIQALATR